MCLYALPVEVLICEVLGRLDAQTLGRVAQTCRLLRDIVTTEKSLLPPGSVRYGSIHIESDAEAIEFADVRVVVGNMKWCDDCVRPSFSRLERIRGDLVMNRCYALQSVDGLAALTSVGGYIYFEYVRTSLDNLRLLAIGGSAFDPLRHRRDGNFDIPVGK
jgi:hypothetical protein